jgi:hypothetical protein
MVSLEKQSFGYISLQLQEDLQCGLELLDKYTDHRKEVTQLLHLYDKCSSLYAELAVKYYENGYKVKGQKIIFNSISEKVKQFNGAVGYHALYGVGKKWCDVYDRLVLTWESLYHNSKIVDEASKIDTCWGIYNELCYVLEDLDEDIHPKHEELIHAILDGWEISLSLYTDMYNSEVA